MKCGSVVCCLPGRPRYWQVKNFWNMIHLHMQSKMQEIQYNIFIFLWSYRAVESSLWVENVAGRRHGARSWRHGFWVSNFPLLALLTLRLRMTRPLLQRVSLWKRRCRNRPGAVRARHDTLLMRRRKSGSDRLEADVEAPYQRTGTLAGSTGIKALEGAPVRKQ